MADKTLIQWSDYTLNFLVGCSKVSAGCDNCYAIDTAHSLEKRFGSEKYKGLTVLNNNKLDWTGELRVIEELILKPLNLKKPRKIFVNSMSDLFHEKIFTYPYAKILMSVTRFFHVMLEAPQHQYQILTKRPHIMRNFVKRFLFENDMDKLPKHIWLGVSVENQRTADVRIPKLLEIPGATKWLSCEPLLGEVDLENVGPNGLNALDGQFYTNGQHVMTGEKGYLDKVDWVVVGGESGKGARRMYMDDAMKILRDCKMYGVPVFMKQMGTVCSRICGFKDKKGGDMSEWPEYYRVRKFSESK